MNPYYPVFLNVQDKRCVVLGGGQVALRKVRSLLEHGAAIVVISPKICWELRDMVAEGRIDVHLRAYRKGDLGGAHVVLVTTNKPSVNARVAAEAHRIGVLVNVADDPGLSGFIVPSTVSRGDITIAVSSGGKSPALARKIRTELERGLVNEYALLVQLVGEVRLDLSRREIEVGSDRWQKALDLDLLIDLLKRGETEEARSVLLMSLTGAGTSVVE